jgi:hypothetical protein
VAVAMHQARLPRRHINRKSADERVFQHLMMAGFSGDFHRGLLRGNKNPQNNDNGNQNFSHRCVILDEDPGCTSKTLAMGTE